MEHTRIIEVKQNILAANDEAADAFRAERAAEGTFFVDVMASPGAGKTTLLLALIRELRARAAGELGVIEADLESDVDALKIKEAGVASVELNTRGVCHVEMRMVEAAFKAFEGDRFDYLFLENIGNLVCPADFDTGAHTRIMLLSVPEGWDKVMKYPPMFAAVDALANGDADVEEMKNEYDCRRRLILDGLAACGIECFPPKGAFYVFPNIGAFGLSSEEFCTRLIDEENVALVPGSAFGESGEGFARVSYAYSVRHIEKALERIGRFVQRLR